MFGRKNSPDDQVPEPPTPPTESVADPRAPKGRPTPTRKEAEARRREVRRIPADPKAAKKAEKLRARKERSQARAAMMSGDERYLPPRDQGPVKAFARDFIDCRWRLSEFFVFLAIGILIAAFIRNPQVQATVSLLWFLVTALVALELVWVLTRLSGNLKERWPEKNDRKGALFYAGMRALQIRKLRIPPPRIKVGEKPQ